MVRARVTSKGQVTLPAEMRKRLDIKPGDDVDFVMEEKATYVTVVKRKSILDFYGILKDEVPADVADMTPEEMEETIGEAIAERFERKLRRERE